ncbi:hypothetical protein KZ483_13325 [Paenibacillus sp. sptzw28]|uniref:hypothetical protein n=1 Tax=Paenibacillus sp. sptzw28 TaxID=715179 RepID=UPI001C6E2F13|nr:hypothetical protein [Paenibacillus sp. sptzw28]QYR23777.1 hypothetical protein KZ483_13325 [Paenibacillus sp. sptzw28]
MKKGLLLFVAFALFFAVSAGSADAKPRGGGFKSPKQSFTQTPSKSSDSVSKSSSGTTAGTTKSGAATTSKPGFFSGGSFMKGLMIGGLAGMLFGGMLGSGFMSNMLGLLINVLAIYVLIVAIRGIFLYFRNRRKPAHTDDRSRY